MFSTELVVDFAKANASMYNDGGYMIDAFNRGATGNGELAKILAAITDDLWARGYSNEDLAKIYGGNKMRIYAQVWEGKPPELFLRGVPGASPPPPGTAEWVLRAMTGHGERARRKGNVQTEGIGEPESRV